MITDNFRFQAPSVKNYPFDKAVLGTFKVLGDSAFYKVEGSVGRTAKHFIERLNRSFYTRNHRKRNKSLQTVCTVEPSSEYGNHHFHILFVLPEEMNFDRLEHRIRSEWMKLSHVVKSRTNLNEPDLQRAQTHFDFQECFSYIFKKYPILSECVDFSLKPAT